MQIATKFVVRCRKFVRNETAELGWNANDFLFQNDPSSNGEWVDSKKRREQSAVFLLKKVAVRSDSWFLTVAKRVDPWVSCRQQGINVLGKQGKTPGKPRIFEPKENDPKEIQKRSCGPIGNLDDSRSLNRATLSSLEW
jgi:hypothetical protein